MKKLFLLLLFAAGMIGGAAAQDEAPKALLAKFQEKYSKAEDAYWYEGDAGNYVVEFSMGDNMLTVTFSPEADILKVQKNLDEEKLPADIKKALAQKYTDAQINSIMQIKEKDKDMYFALELDGGEELINLHMDGQGKVLHEERTSIEAYDDSDYDEE